MAVIPGTENINWLLYLGNIIYYVSWFLGVALFFTCMYMLFHFLSFKIKVVELCLNASGENGTFAVGKITKNRFKWNKTKTAWISMKPWFNRKEFDRFDNRFVYANSTVFAFKMPDGNYVPGDVVINQKETQTLIAQINPIPNYIRRWEEVELVKDSAEFSNLGTWDKYGQFITILIVSLICMSMVVATVYFTYKFAAPGISATDKLTNAINNLGNIQGVNR